MTGEVPEGWSRCRLADFLVEHHDRVGTRCDLDALSLTKHHGLVLARERFGRALHSKSVANYRHVRHGDIVVDPMLLWDGALARLRRFDEGFVSPDYRVFRAAPTRVDLDFLEQWLHGPAGRRAFANSAKGTNIRRNRIGREDFLRVEVLSPPLPEQKKIAAILSSVNGAIQATQAVIDQTMRVQDGLFQDLLTHGIGHTRFKVTKSGEIPESWTEGRVGDFLTLQRGFDITKEQVRAGPYPVVSSSGVSYFHAEWKVEPPGVVTGRKGKLGDVYFLDEPFWPHDTSLWVKDFKGNDPSYVRWFLLALRLEKFDAATSVPTLNRNNVHPLRAAFPPLAEQRIIATELATLGNTINQMRGILRKQTLVKSGLLADLLTGRVRVTP